MNTFELLQKAIKERKPISFDYNKNGELSHRIVNPYVLYIYTAKQTGEESTKLGVVQIDGDSDSKEEKPFPSFRDFLGIEDILNVQILENEPSFIPPFHKDYNPDSDRYRNLIIKV